MQLEHNGTANSSGTCEWSTGCVGLHHNEWVAAKFEWRENANGSISCVTANTFLKKSELGSGGLPASQKLAIAKGAVVELASKPKPITGEHLRGNRPLVSCYAAQLSCGVAVKPR